MSSEQIFLNEIEHGAEPLFDLLAATLVHVVGRDDTTQQIGPANLVASFR